MGVCGIGGHRNSAANDIEEREFNEALENSDDSTYVHNKTNRLGSKVDGYYSIKNVPPTNMTEFTASGEQTADTRLKPLKLNP
jgi:hypothetical protein